MPIGIRAINDFAFKKIFGSPENKLALISLLNAILQLPTLIVEVTIQNPFGTVSSSGAGFGNSEPAGLLAILATPCSRIRA